MEINKHIGFVKAEMPELFTYLVTEGIPFEEVYDSCVLDIYESNPHWMNIRNFVKQGNAVCLSETIFSQQELSCAEWLRIRSKWRNGYPQPENGFAYEGITYSCENNCVDCGTGLYQVEDFRIKKTPNWGKRHFMMLNWVEDELFLDDVAKTVLINSGLSEMEFRNVKNKSGTDTLPNIFQLAVPTVLPEGIVLNHHSIDEIYECNRCGIKKYHPTGVGMHTFQRSIFEGAPEVVKTAEVFGWGHSASRLIIVSQKMYRVITQGKLNRGLVFEPLELV